MAKIVFAMNVSLDGFVDYDRFSPDPVLFAHWIEVTRASAGSIYGRRLYEIMRYWDDEHPEWGAAERDFAEAWRAQKKWVVSRTLTSVGPNGTLISEDVEGAIRELKDSVDGVLDVGGPDLVQSLTKWGLVDEYRLYYLPVVLGSGDPFFVGRPPDLRLASTARIGDAAVCLAYVPA